MKRRYVKWLGGIVIICFFIFLLQSQIQDQGNEGEPANGQHPVDESLDELLDESFTRPPESPNGNRAEVGRLPTGVLNFGIVEQIPSPLCPSGSLSAPVSARVRFFQPLIEGGDGGSPLYLYSASLSLSEVPSATTYTVTVNAFGLVETGFHAALFCQLWYRSGLRPLSLIPARLQVLSDRQSQASELKSALLHCTESDMETEDRVPYAVSIVGAAHLCGDPILILPFLGSPNFVSDVIEAHNGASNTGIAVCSPTPLNDQMLDPDWLHEWLEAQRVMGARRVYLYHLQSEDSSLSRILYAYTKPSQTGMVTLLDWPLPRDLTMVDNGRTVAINDCLRRAASEKFWRVLIADVNKIVVPNSKYMDWHALVNGVESPVTDAVLLQAANTNLADIEEREAMGGSPLKISVRQRSMMMRPPGEDANMFVDPLKVKSVEGNGKIQYYHHQDNVNEWDRIKKVGSEDALVLDYDIATGTNRGITYGTDMVVDERMAPFTFRLIAAVRASRTAMRI